MKNLAIFGDDNVITNVVQVEDDYTPQSGEGFVSLQTGIGATYDASEETTRIASDTTILANAEIENGNRDTRLQLIQETDYLMLSDSTLTDSQKTELETYRQALRDITDHANWPSLEDDDWPTAPDFL